MQGMHIASLYGEITGTPQVRTPWCIPMKKHQTVLKWWHTVVQSTKQIASSIPMIKHGCIVAILWVKSYHFGLLSDSILIAFQLFGKGHWSSYMLLAFDEWTCPVSCQKSISNVSMPLERWLSTISHRLFPIAVFLLWFQICFKLKILCCVEVEQMSHRFFLSICVGLSDFTHGGPFPHLAALHSLYVV